MNWLNKQYSKMPRRRRLMLLALAVWICGVLMTACLLNQAGVREVLYKTF